MFFKKREDNLEDGMLKGRGGKYKTQSWVAYVLFFLFIILAGLWFVFFSGYFRTVEYDIIDLNVLEKDVVTGEIGKFLDTRDGVIKDKRNIFLIDEQSVADHLMNTFFIESATVDKIYPNILRLKIKERQRSVILVTRNKIYIVDDYGVITDHADQATVSTTREFLSSSVPVDSLKEIFVIVPTSTNYEIGWQYTNTNNVRGWLDLAEKLRNAGIWFKAIQINDDEPGILRVILKENKDVIMDEDISLDSQIDTLRQFMQSKPVWDDIHEYVDVRIPGRIYYK
jgi:hypothetical protein